MSGLFLLYLAIFGLLCLAIFFGLGLHDSIKDAITQKKLKKAKAKMLVDRNNVFLKGVSKLNKQRAAVIDTAGISKVAYFVIAAVCGVICYYLCSAAYGSPVIGVAFGIAGLYAPMLFFTYRKIQIKAIAVEKLESSMMVISNSYIITDDLIASIQENITNLEYPAPFKDFLSYVKFIDNDVSACLRRVEDSVNNEYFSQWVDALVLAQTDRSMKYVAVSVVESMHDMSKIQKESEVALYSVWQDYFIAIALVIATPLLFRFLMADAYTVLVTSLFGQILFALLIIAIVFSIVQAMKINRPLLV